MYRLHEFPSEPEILEEEPPADGTPNAKQRFEKKKAKAERKYETAKQRVRDAAIEDKWPIVCALCLHWVRLALDGGGGPLLIVVVCACR